ncbi:syntaxin 6, N-terminal-domain-containing protein [Protomyces lactucae-debilis]|uniref:t-SNARE affecting a late Golgi compartment protein 1 n=1 Tax=Protomyces lactucae-debilis TaxID=2754530 RepID=A0A1Y2FGT6_PROLT|nr:syntaxin 6, N-terminal-domain-containing protein [Protomyces lactucae-debilis]ORY83142.1 syntaxin 6, N-terminal-domain-containing protein [Protomyces lactucae-debilis]
MYSGPSCWSRRALRVATLRESISLILEEYGFLMASQSLCCSPWSISTSSSVSSVLLVCVCCGLSQNSGGNYSFISTSLVPVYAALIKLMSDPFIEVRDEVEVNLEQAALLLDSHKRIAATSAPDSAEVVQTLEDFDATIQDIQQDIADLEESIAAAAGQPEKYNLTAQEVERRQGFIRNTKLDVKRLQESIKKGHAPVDQDVEMSDEEEDQAYAQQVMAEQDEQLDSVFDTVGTLRMQANEMGQELSTQAEILHEFEEAVDKSAGKLKRGLKGIESFLKKNEETKSNCCIVLLIVILLVLLVMVLML